MLRLSKLSAILISMFFVQSVDGQIVKPGSVEAQVRRSAEDFVAAFVSLDWARFRAHFAEDAMVFFPPSAELPTRVNGKRAIEKVFEGVFENARKRSSGPPYLIIEPLETHVQIHGDVAVVTFHLNDPGMFGRRTVVFRKFAKSWLIVHLHASGVRISNPTAGEGARSPHNNDWLYNLRTRRSRHRCPLIIGNAAQVLRQVFNNARHYA